MLQEEEHLKPSPDNLLPRIYIIIIHKKKKGSILLACLIEFDVHKFPYSKIIGKLFFFQFTIQMSQSLTNIVL